MMSSGDSRATREESIEKERERTRSADTERERERGANPTGGENDEDARIRTCAQRALPPFVEKGRRNYVVAQLMRPRGTIIW